MKRVILAFFLSLVLVSTVLANEKHPITFDDFIGLGRVSDPQVSPDGKMIAYVVTYYDDKEANKGNSDIWLASIEGGEPKQLTTNPEKDSNPRWSPDGKLIAFISNRDGTSQIWTMPINGGEADRITNISTGASGVIWSPDGNYLAFVSDVNPDCKDDACNKKKLEEKKSGKVMARVIDRLLYRHWTEWRAGLRSHLLIVPASGGEVKDLTPWDKDVPTITLGSSQDYSFSPDGKEICFVMNPDPVVAISTNNDLFTMPISGGETKQITTNKANDTQPRYSPDGRYIAYRAMMRPGFEADRNRLMVYDRKKGEAKNLTEEFDRSVGEIVWSNDSKNIYFNAADHGYYSIYKISVNSGKVTKLIDKSYNRNLSITPDGKTLVFVRQSMNHPPDIYRADLTGKKVRRLTRVNDSILNELDLNEPEEFWYAGADGDKVHGFILKPPGFDVAKKYPTIILIHGGPQGAWSNNFHYRWNAQMFSAPGYVSVFMNPRGSTGYGQKFVDQISKDWGGRVYEDLMRGVDYVIENYDYVDADRMGAAGGSYGGYMVNWIAGHTDRFKCLINHAGLFNLTSMYGATEELWFPEWEFDGTPWENSEHYEKWTPNHFVQNWKTPMLVLHGEQDFRVPVGEALQTFTALQRMNVPSKLVYFPDEAHWISKPRNADLWWKEVHSWFKKYLK